MRGFVRGGGGVSGCVTVCQRGCVVVCVCEGVSEGVERIRCSVSGASKGCINAVLRKKDSVE